MLNTLYSLLALIVMAMACYGLGRPLLRGLAVGHDDCLSTTVWSLAIGAILAGMAIFVAGLLGVLYIPVIGVLTVAACFWGIGQIIHGNVAFFSKRSSNDLEYSGDSEGEIDTASCGPPTRCLLAIAIIAGVVVCFGSLIGALAPPTAGDALCYHLELPKEYLAEHCVMHLPYSDNSTFPLLTEMWYVWGLAIDGGVGAQLVHWGLGVLLAAASVVLATGVLGRPWAWIVGPVVLLTPGINNQMTAPMNDVALALMATLAVAAWCHALVEGDDRRWFILAGLATGGALGTKYVAGILILTVGLHWGWLLIRQRERRRFLLEGAAIVAVVAAVVGGPWYARAAWHRGNPIYPFFGEVLAQDTDRSGAPHSSAPHETLPASKSPLGRGPVALATAPWLITMHPETFGGRGHQLGILFLASLPGLVVARRLRGMEVLLSIAAIYFVVWFLLRQNVRFLFPIVPLLAIATVWVWIEMRRLQPYARTIASGTFAFIVGAMAIVPLVRSSDQWRVVLGLESRETYLCHKEPTYPASLVANAMLPGDAQILSQDYRAFYFNHRVTRESIYRRETGYTEAIPDPGELSQNLRDRGFTHLLLAEKVRGPGIDFDPTLSHLADAQLTVRPEAMTLLTEYLYRDIDGAERRYRLMALR